MAEENSWENFKWMTPQVDIFSFARGRDAQRLYYKVSETITSGLWYDSTCELMRGSSTFSAARTDSLLRPFDLRVATLKDFGIPEMVQRAKTWERKSFSDNGEEPYFYFDAPAIVVRSETDSYEPNAILMKELLPQMESKMGRIDLPALVTGFDVVPSEDKRGYGLKISPREDFYVLHDERLSGGYNGRLFNEVDRQGLPIFRDDGARTWYARDEGLSGLALGFMGLSSNDENLNNSLPNGRIILVRKGIVLPGDLIPTKGK